MQYAFRGSVLRRAVLGSRARWLVIVTAVAAVLSLGAAHAEDVYVDVAINGRHVESGALVHGDRTYVKLSDVAGVLDGRYIYDSDLKVAFVLTGRYQNLVADRLAAINPAIEAYNPISPIVTHMGIHYGVPGPHLTIAFTPSGIVSAFEVLYTDDSILHQPWFDQEDGLLDEFPGFGFAYSQHVYVLDPKLIELGGHTTVAFNGRALDLATDAFLWVDNELYVRLRDLAAASGGGVGWDTAARLATAKVVAGADLTHETLGALNGSVAEYYAVSSTFDPAVGYRSMPDGPGITVGVEGDDRVAVFGANFPESNGPWFPWYDQPHGSAVDLPGFGRGYSQHIYLQEQGAIKD